VNEGTIIFRLSRLLAITIESHVLAAGKPKLLDEIRSFTWTRRYSLRTERAYLDFQPIVLKFVTAPPLPGVQRAKGGRD